MKIVLYGILALSVGFWIYQMISTWKALKGLKKANKEFQDSANRLTETLKKKTAEMQSTRKSKITNNFSNN